jgi:zinc transport system substrate-binding protein
VFREPNFEPALVDTVIAGTPARSGVLDPEGASLTEGPELYFDLMRALANSLGTCLASSS